MNFSHWQFYTVVMVPAAVLMAMEIVSSRLLAPQFGSSVYVWGSIIGVFLAAMSLGYAWGGRLADRRPTMTTLGHLLLGAAMAQGIVLLIGRRVVLELGTLTGGSPVGTLLTTGLLFAPATVFLATVSPYAVKLSTRDLGLLGGTAGNLYALSTAASLTGTLLATFVLIPHLDFDTILRLLLLATTLCGLLALAPEARQQRLSLVLGTSLLIFASLPRDPVGGPNSGYLVERMTPYQTIHVYDTDGIRFMTGDGTIQSAVEIETGAPWLAYARQAPTALLIQPEMQRLLVLGMGAGSVGAHLRTSLPELEIDYVDIDPAVPELAEEFMSFRTDERSRVHIDDARRFLQGREGTTWDYIYADTYIGLAVPFHLTTVEFFQEVAAHMAPGGVFGLNLASDLDQPFARAIIRSVRSAFDHVSIFGIRGWANHLVLASSSPIPRTREEYLAVARELEPRFPFEPSLSRMAGWLVQRELDLTEAYLLTDRYAPVSHLIQLDPEAKGALAPHDFYSEPPTTPTPPDEAAR